jgi:hypothetical protein
MFGSATTRRSWLTKSEMEEQFRFAVESLTPLKLSMSFDAFHFEQLRVVEDAKLGSQYFGNLFGVVAFRRQQSHPARGVGNVVRLV